MFICMSGPAGTGKSTMAEVLAKRYNAIIVSTDAIREELFGDAAIQDNPKEVFEIAYKRIEEGLRKTHKVIFDATNLSPKNRRDILEKAKVWNKGFNICYRATTTEEIAKERNQQRNRQVPDDVIQKQFTKYVEPSYEEGWDAIFEF